MVSLDNKRIASVIHMQTKDAITAQPLVHTSQGASPSPVAQWIHAVIMDSTGHSLFSPSFAVLTDSLGWPTIENAQRAGLGAFTPAHADGFLSSATSRLRRYRSLPIAHRQVESEGKRKKGMSTFFQGNR